MTPPLPWSWGARPDEVADTYPCAGLVAGRVRSVHRAVSVDAPVGVLYRWVSQLHVAPYSYDLVDNRGHRSPQTLVVESADLTVGDRFVSVFAVTSLRRDDHVTAVTLPGPARVFGPMACTYRVRPDGAGSRLVVRLDISATTALSRLAAAPLAWGDLVMMRKQLLTLKHLAETTPR